MHFCGRQFSPEEIHRINHWVTTEPDLSRQELSRRFCRDANWRKPDGGLKDMSCRVAFLKMDKAGIIRLPAPKRAFFKPGSRLKHSPLDLDTTPLVQSAGELDPAIEVVGKSFLAHPEALPVECQDFDGIGALVSENKQISGKRILFKNLPAYLGQTVDAFTEVGRFHRHKYPHLGRDLDHDSFFQKALRISIRFGHGWPFN